MSEFKKITPNEIKKKIHKPIERNISCFIGGSILSALGSFKQMWVTKEVMICSVFLLFLDVF
jgi:actin-related protein